MSQIDDVKQNLGKYFNDVSGPCYLRILDTPHVWGADFGRAMMPQALARQAEFERAVVEVIQKARYRCDLASLNSPDPDWGRAILGAIDTAMSTRSGRGAPTQFRFLFGQTPTSPVSEPPNFTDFKAALLRLVRARRAAWEVMPEIWLGRFYRLQEGIISSLKTKVFGDAVIDSDDTKMTWNHSKIIVVDGTEALMGGHNLNMDLFRSYPPVHDLSVVVHGPAAHGSHLFLDKMWACGHDLLTKDCLDAASLTWKNGDADRTKPADPLASQAAIAYMGERQQKLIRMHGSGQQDGAPDPVMPAPAPLPQDMRERDLMALDELALPVFPLRPVYARYDKFTDYKLASRLLSVGKYWTGPNLGTDYQKGSEVMKERLIKGAKHKICMSQMDLVSAWKKNWSDHVVCQWIMQALQANPALTVQVVVSPLDAAAGAEGDQYSFGSGAARTFELMKYYMTHDAASDAPLPDPNGLHAAALKRLHVAPFFFTDKVPANMTGEGETYKWPGVPTSGNTATLKQVPLSVKPPRNGVIGSAVISAISGSGFVFPKVAPAPGNHAKVMIVDDEAYVVGSDNLYPGSLSEFNYLVEGKAAVDALVNEYWKPLWQYSSPHAISG